MMVEDMMFDPILASKVLLQVRLPPHEELRVMWMWTTYYTNDDSGFSTGKSWTLGLVSALRSILMPERISGVLSKTFAQGKLIFQNFDRWYNTSAIFRSCVKHQGGKPRLIHGNDAWVAYFRGGSEVRVLPPNFLNDSERIRSERWNDAYLDEWTTYGNFKALNTTIMGRITNKNYFRNCPVRQNHVHLASTPQFTHHPSYKMVEMVDTEINRNNPDYGRFSCNYRHVPNTEEWQWLINRKIIYHMQVNNPRGVVKSEIDGVWSTDSSSYYSSEIVSNCRLNMIPFCNTRMTGEEVFICGVDVARGGGDQNQDGEGDDFAMSVFRLIPGSMFPHHVLTVRKNKISDVQMSGLIHKYHRKMGFNFIVFDPGGGGLFVKDKLKNEMQLIENEMVRCTPIVTWTDNSGVIGDTILIPFSRSDPYLAQMWGKTASDSVLVNRIHQEFKGAIENRKVGLCGSWKGWEGNGSLWDVGRMRYFLNMHKDIKEEERCKAEMDLAVTQLIHVDYKRDENNAPVLDAYGMYNFKSKQKKDAAYSLLYAYCGVLVYRFLHDSGMDVGNNDDKDTVACATEEI